MKKLLYTSLALLFTYSLSAQCISETSKIFKLEDGLVKMERFDTQGNLIEVGSYLQDGSLEGKWVSYRVDGSTLSIAYYSAGEKVGTWKHFDSFKNQLHEVSYENGILASSESTNQFFIVKK